MDLWDHVSGWLTGYQQRDVIHNTAKHFIILLAPYKACYIRDHGKHDLFDFFLHPLANLATEEIENAHKKTAIIIVPTAMEDIFFFHISFTPIL